MRSGLTVAAAVWVALGLSVSAAKAAETSPPAEPTASATPSAEPVEGSGAPLRPSVVTTPEWIRRPSPDQIGSVYPERAMRMGVSGRAVMTCDVTALGAMEACRVVQETAADFGFGAAELKLARYFFMRPVTRDGQPVGGAVVTIPVSFRISR